MAKSRRNVSRRKRQQKRRNSRKNFRKMSGGTEISEEYKTFLLNVEWKVPNSVDKYDTIQERLGNKSITWVDKESIDNTIRDSSTIKKDGKLIFRIENIERLKSIADGNGGMIKNEKFYFISVKIIILLRPSVGPSTNAYSAHVPNSA